ncbi:MAG: serine protease [Alphaproteobacteria bacterium]|jgi:hypothetical protein|nr:serine protease [Alphaproteobacteria bacterium]
MTRLLALVWLCALLATPQALASETVYRAGPSQPCTCRCGGSAVAINPQGYWLTARHVFAGCTYMELRTNEGERYLVDNILHHPTADLTLFRTAPFTTGLPVSLNRLRNGQAGFHVGYPQNRPGAVHSQLTGESWMEQEKGREPIMVWSEVSRDLNNNEIVSGLSGGPVLDADGAIVGITFGIALESRAPLTTTVEAIEYLLRYRGILGAATEAPANVRVASLNAANYSRVAERLRRNYVVARLYCEG